MRRLLLTAAATVALVAAWWLAEDGALRQRLGEVGSSLIERGQGDRPNWGDVAEKVGAFTEEERGLRETIGGEGDAAEPAASD